MSAQRIFQSPPAYDSILSCLSQQMLVRVSQSSRLFSEAVASYSRRAFNINRHLSPWFDDPLEFRSLQARTGMLISGSNALQFLDRSYYPGSDLDLYLSSSYALEVGLWFMDKGWTFEPTDFQTEDFKELAKPAKLRALSRPDAINESYPFAGVATVFTFRKNGLQLQVVVAKVNRSPLECVLGFHSSKHVPSRLSSF